jgi:hypothetical protein
MSIERYVETIPQSNDAVPKQLPLERGPGNYLLLQVSSALVTVTLMEDGPREVFANILGGLFVKRVKPWKNLRIDGPIGTSCTFFIGAQVVDRDETDIRLQTSVIAGVTLTADSPAATLNDNAPVALPNNAQTPVFAGNGSRRRMKVSFASNAVIPPATVFFRKNAAVNNLMEVQPGAVYPFDGTYAVDVRNDSGGALSAMIFEEA